jgi:DNA-binding response OmpR family regulator
MKIAKNRIEKNTKHFKIDDQYIILDDEFIYHMDDHSLYCCSEMIHLTKKEDQLLTFMIRNQNNIVTLPMIENEIWPDKETNVNTIRTLIRRLRTKLKHKFIETVSTRGYKFNFTNKIRDFSHL